MSSKQEIKFKAPVVMTHQLGTALDMEKKNTWLVLFSQI